jgi:hypothetical protein
MSFTLHDDAGDTHFAAQGREEDDELDGVDDESAALFASMRVLMWLRPYLTKRGFLESCS